MSVIIAFVALAQFSFANAQTSPGGGAVLHLALVKSMREHVNFEIAQARLRQANPDRRLITMVRERTYEDVIGRIRDVALADLDRDVRNQVKALDRQIELVYVQINDLGWMRGAWLNEDHAPQGPNPVLALRGHLAPNARLVLVGHSLLGFDPEASAERAQRLLEYLGAPQGSLIAQVTPTILPYERADFAKYPSRRLAASLVKGFGFAALGQLGGGQMGTADAVTFPLVALGAATLYHRTLPGPSHPDTEQKPLMFRPFRNVDDALFTAAVGVGTAAMAHGFFHVGPQVLNGEFVTHGLAATGVFFALSLLPKVAHNLHVAYVERTRHRNGARLFTSVEGAQAAYVEELHANDARNFDCARNLNGGATPTARVPDVTNLNQ